jgi:hypothetical protein
MLPTLTSTPIPPSDGKHLTNLTSLVLIRIGGTGHYLATLQIVCPLITSLSKLGILCLFHRLVVQTSLRYRIIIRLTFLLTLSIMVAQVLIPFIDFRPFSKTWNPDPAYPGRCFIPGLALWMYLGIPNVVTTLINFGIPVPDLYNLQVSRVMKVGLAIVFGVCIFGVMAAVMRFQAFLSVKDFRNITYEDVKPLCWTVAESGIYLVAGSMLGLKALVKRIGKRTALERFFDRDAKASGRWKHKSAGRLRARDARARTARKEHRNLWGGAGQMRLIVDTPQAHLAADNEE